jgi:hypothetical protein
MTCTLLVGCQVRGLVGSNESETLGTTSGGTGADVSTSGVASSLTTNITTVDDSDTTTSSGSTSEDETTEGFIFDVMPEDVPEVCEPPQTRACDSHDDAWYHAMGFPCHSETPVAFDSTVEAGALYVHEGMIGAAEIFTPRQGEKMVVLSTGRAHELPMPLDVLLAVHPECEPRSCPSTALSSVMRPVLPEPLEVRKVAKDARDCVDDPSLVGTGDCSNSLEDHWTQGTGAFDYSELRVRATVPDNADAFQYDFAFFSAEYPYFIDHVNAAYNDMYVAWLESEAWTGNISFDEAGNPITVHSVLLDYRTVSDQCPTCQAPELSGFSMEQHAGTKWLTTRAPVQPGEEIELIFAIFDLSDPVFDSAVLLDGFEWTCADGPPVTWAG